MGEPATHIWFSTSQNEFLGCWYGEAQRVKESLEEEKKRKKEEKKQTLQRWSSR